MMINQIFLIEKLYLRKISKVEEALKGGVKKMALQ